MERQNNEDWYTYKCGALTVLKWCPLLKIHAVFVSFVAFMSGLALSMVFEARHQPRLFEPLISYNAPRQLEVNFLHPVFVLLLALVFIAAVSGLVRMVLRHFSGRALILGRRKLWVRGLNGSRPVKWDNLIIRTLRPSSSVLGLAISLEYKGRKVVLREQDFYLHDLKYLRDAIEWTRPDLKRRAQVSKKAKKPNLTY